MCSLGIHCPHCSLTESLGPGPKASRGENANWNPSHSLCMYAGPTVRPPPYLGLLETAVKYESQSYMRENKFPF